MKLLSIYFWAIFIVNLTLLFAQFNQLRDYDIIDVPIIRTKRGTSKGKEIYLHTKFRNFKLIFNPSQNLLSNDFKAMNVDRYGNKKSVFIDPEQYYNGYVSGFPNSSATAFFGGNGEISFNIELENENYEIESISRYQKKNVSLLVYRLSDLVSNWTKSNTKYLFINDFIRSKSSVLQRKKRNIEADSSNDDKKFCSLKLVADYRFHRKHGRGEIARTHNYIVELVDNINQLFKNTEFYDSTGKKYFGYGFIIKEIRVHTQWTVGFPGHYNEYRPSDNNSWEEESLLSSFSSHDYKDFCLAHLFTYQSFSSGTVGLAYLATWKMRDYGGICSRKLIPNGNSGFKSTNTAWSTYRDSGGNPLVSLSAYLVTAHEFGHNWGADHDPNSAACNPKSSGGGKYIMYMYSIVGYEKNNRIFSPCSRSNIGETIRAMGSSCFVNNLQNYCGNHRVEETEECDVGLKEGQFDTCCTSNCKLRPGALCSPKNHECCTSDCRLKSKGNVCAIANPLNPCLGNSTCDGVNKMCSPPTPLSPNKCTEHGECKDGKCKPYCNLLNLTACICDTVEDSCKICCQNTSHSVGEGKCKPAHTFWLENEGELVLNNGRPCVQGVCFKGECKKKVTKLVERIWKIIDNFDTNLFAAFLLDNLVGSVIFFSLVLWIPATIMVRYYDSNYALH